VKFGLVARDVRLLAALLVLCLTALVLVVTSWPSGDDLAPPREARELRVEDATASQTPVPAAGRRVARGFAEAYFTTTPSPAVTRRRLEPYSSEDLIAAMRVNSGALALRTSKAHTTSEAEVVALQAQDGTDGNALVAIVEHSTRANGKTRTELVTVTLELVEEDGEWLVAEVLVP
jgi:hypothetical protein